MSIKQIPSLLIGDLSAGTAENDSGVVYIAIGPIDENTDSDINIDEIEARALYEWLGWCLGQQHSGEPRG